MRKATVVLVAAMIVLAGCSGGGGTATPTDGADDTEDGTMTPGGDVGPQPSTEEVFSSLNSSSGGDPFGNATELDMTLYNGSDSTLTVLIQNNTDTGTQLTQFSSEGETLTLYSTSDYVAQRNSTSGEIQYGEPDGNIGFGVNFAAAFALFAGLSYISLVEWEPAGTTSVNGGTGYVYEATSLNETALNNQGNQQMINPSFEQSDVQSVSGQMVVTSDIQFQSLTVEIETPDGTYGTDLSLRYDPVTIDKPDWVDESQAP